MNSLFLLLLFFVTVNVSAYLPSHQTSQSRRLLLTDPYNQPASSMYGEIQPDRSSWNGTSIGLAAQEKLRSVFTSWRCTPHHSINVTCLVHNMYIHNGEHHFVLLTTDANPLNDYNLRFCYLSVLRRPKELRFNTLDEAQEFLGKVDESPNLTLYYALPWGWLGNFGHAIFDGLYPNYLGLIELGLEHETFDSIVDVKTCHRTCELEHIIQRFGGGTLNDFEELKERYKDGRYLRLKLAVMGAARKHQRHVHHDVSLAGRPIDGLRKFSRRMFDQFGVPLNKSATPDIFNVYFFNNKRWSAEEDEAVKALVQRTNAKNNSAIRMTKIEWKEPGGFLQQLQLLAQIDVYVSGPGTGLMNHPFMRDGTFVINTGSCVVRPKAIGGKIPWSMEVYMCEGSPYQRCLYPSSRTRCTHNTSTFDIDEIETLIHKAYELRGFDTPVASGVNLPFEHRVFKETCMHDLAACDRFFEKFNTGSEWIEDVVYETKKWAPSHPLDLDRDFLRRVRSKYQDELQATRTQWSLLHRTMTLFSFFFS